MYDLIIVDYDLFNEKDKQDVATLKKNMNAVDGCLGAVFNKAQEKGQDLIITSLYGTVGRINLIDREYVNINFSEKAPLIITGKGIDRSRYDLAGNGSIANLAAILYSQLGYESPKSLFNEKGVKTGKGKKKSSPMMLVAIALIVILALVFVYAYINGYI
jgi:bisphosphoglycerate-independent phosphoglycerate mutase (AlkP superfamily)